MAEVVHIHLSTGSGIKGGRSPPRSSTEQPCNNFTMVQTQPCKTTDKEMLKDLNYVSNLQLTRRDLTLHKQQMVL